MSDCERPHTVECAVQWEMDYYSENRKRLKLEHKIFQLHSDLEEARKEIARLKEFIKDKKPNFAYEMTKFLNDGTDEYVDELKAQLASKDAKMGKAVKAFKLVQRRATNPGGSSDSTMLKMISNDCQIALSDIESGIAAEMLGVKKST